MLYVRVGPSKIPRSSMFKFWKFIVAALSLAVVSTFFISKYSDLFSMTKDNTRQMERFKLQKKPVSPCPTTLCTKDFFSFYIQSGASSVIPPKICFRNELILGADKNNAGVGINVVIINGGTGEVINTGNYDMWAGEVKDLIDFLRTIETGSIVLMASYDEPATKLNEEARKLILELGSSYIKTLGFRDNWIFVGGKGATFHNPYEKHIKNKGNKNLYGGWPELIDITGCIPKFIV